MSNLLQVDWLTFRPATAVAKTRTYVQLPTFTYATTWLGASEIATQFNFSASKNFVLRNRPAKPSGVNYCLCIRYRVGDTVYRWKLWENVGEQIPHVRLYNGEIIKKHFVLEVWTVNGGTTISQASTINIITSVVNIPTDYRDLSSTSLATGVEYNKASVAITQAARTLSTTDADFIFESDIGVDKTGSAVNGWTSSVGSIALTPNGGITYTDTDAAINNKPCINIPALSTASLYATGLLLSSTRHIFLLLNQDTWAADRKILHINDGASSAKLAVTQLVAGASPQVQVRCNGNIVGTLALVTVGAYKVIEITYTGVLGTVYTAYNKSIAGVSAESVTASVVGAEAVTNLSLGSYNIGSVTAAQMKIAALIGYNVVKTGTDLTDIYSYLNEKYGGAEQGFTFPASPGLGNAWYSND